MTDAFLQTTHRIRNAKQELEVAIRICKILHIIHRFPALQHNRQTLTVHFSHQTYTKSEKKEKFLLKCMRFRHSLSTKTCKVFQPSYSRCNSISGRIPTRLRSCLTFLGFRLAQILFHVPLDCHTRFQFGVVRNILDG